ncbi:MAG: hypothetical protein KBA31_18205 [Alphaproteobacteria bacterium]|nr:hypothetical protein [Alphaproteobacteria bacterium]
MEISFGPARALDAGVWAGTLSPAVAKRLPGAPLKSAGPHVLVLQQPAWNGTELKAPFDGVSVLAIGAGEAAIFLSAAPSAPFEPAARATTALPATAAPQATAPDQASPGHTGDDSAFVAECAQLGTDMERVGKALIARIRATTDGALARQTNPRLFVETPDNFWSVEIQPRRGAIKLVVRTSETKLLRAGLPYEPERPPSYWAMKIYGDQDVETALRFLAVETKATAQAT